MGPQVSNEPLTRARRRETKIRAPHSTSQTIVVNWEQEPKIYFGECNVDVCRSRSIGSQQVGNIKTWTRTHHANYHSDIERIPNA